MLPPSCEAISKIKDNPSKYTDKNICNDYIHTRGYACVCVYV